MVPQILKLSLGDSWELDYKKHEDLTPHGWPEEVSLGVKISSV